MTTMRRLPSSLSRAQRVAVVASRRRHRHHRAVAAAAADAADDEDVDALLSKFDAVYGEDDDEDENVDGEAFDDDDGYEGLGGVAGARARGEEYVADADETVIKVEADANPTDVGNFGMSDVTVAALRKRGVDTLFPIQQAVLEPALSGQDVVGRARTGTGKTLAFSLPIIERLLNENSRSRNPKCIVLAPTRELAKQVENEIFITAPTLATSCVYGGTPIGTQEAKLRRGVDIIVGTPGRVQDLINRGSLNLGEIEFVVLDEADQMLNVGFEEDVEAILQDCPETRQTFLFSATMPSWVKQITKKFLKPQHVVVDLVGDSKQKVADTIDLMSCAVSHANRTSIVMDLVTVYAKDKKAICFAQTKRAADELTAALGRRVASEVLHGDIAQAQALIVDDQVANFLDRAELPARADAEALAAGRDLAGADGEIAAHEQVTNRCNVRDQT